MFSKKENIKTLFLLHDNNMFSAITRPKNRH